MTALTKTAVIAGVAVMALGAGAACTAKSGRSASPGAHQVTIHTFAFAPKSLRVAAGATVRWTNSDQILHTVTSGTREYDPTDSGRVTAEHKSAMFDAPLNDVGATFSYTFRRAGSYHYFCSRHPGMEADVVVT